MSSLFALLVVKEKKRTGDNNPSTSYNNGLNSNETFENLNQTTVSIQPHTLFKTISFKDVSFPLQNCVFKKLTHLFSANCVQPEERFDKASIRRSLLLRTSLIV